MINDPTRTTARKALESMCLAIKPTHEQIYTACDTFARLIARCTGIEVRIQVGKAHAISRGGEAAQ